MTDGEARGAGQQTPRVPNSILREIRKDERGESQREFADAMARVAWEMGVEVYPDDGYVKRLESGSIKWPHRAYRTILEKLCGRPVVQLGFTPTVRSRSSEAPSRDNTALREAIWESGIEVVEFSRKIEVDPKTVERWITRGVIPRPMHRWKSALILGIDESELWSDAALAREIQERNREAPKRKLAKLAASQNGNPNEKSSILPGDSLERALSFHGDDITPDHEERVILAAKNPRRQDPGIVDSLATILFGQRRLEDAIGAAPLVEPVKAEFTVVSRLVAEARGDLRSRVLDIGSQWAQFSGWLSTSNGRLDEANQSYRLALEWALEADKPDMVATALNMQGTTAWIGRKAGPVIGLSRAAQRDNRVSPGVLALAVQQEARGIALSGEAKFSDIDRKFDRARTLVEKAAERPEEEPPWIYFFSSEYLIMQRGLAYRLMGEYAKAIEVLTAGLSAMPVEIRQTEYVASYLMDLAISHAKSGDVDSACLVAQEISVIAKQTNSTKLLEALSGLHTQLEKKWHDNTYVSELGEALRRN